jgi:hypothetical protein
MLQELTHIPFHYGKLSLILRFDNLHHGLCIAALPQQRTGVWKSDTSYLFVEDLQSVIEMRSIQDPILFANYCPASVTGAGVATENVQSFQATVKLMKWQADGAVTLWQNNYRMTEEIINGLSTVYATQGILIPTTVFSTTPNAGPISSTSASWSMNMYNVEKLDLIFKISDDRPAFVPFPRVNNLSVKVEGSPINVYPYQTVERIIEDKVIADYHPLPIDIETSIRGFNYLIPNTAGTDSSLDTLVPLKYGVGHKFYHSNSFIVSQSLAPENGYMKGRCFNGRRQGNSSINITYSIGDKPTVPAPSRYFGSYIPEKYGNNAGHTEQIMAVATCDACIYLRFDANKNRAVAGQILYILPASE